MNIKVNDIVQVISGAAASAAIAERRGKVISVDQKAGKVIVEGKGLVWKHVKRSQKNPQGGRLSKEMPIQMSNVMLVCEKCGQPTRTGVRYLADGSKERFCKKRDCGASLGTLSPPKAAYAKK